MSWNIVIFSSNQKITSIEKIDEELFVPVDFCGILEKHFHYIDVSGNHCEIKTSEYCIDYFLDTEPVSNKMFSLYGEHALYELIKVAKLYNWQIFDTGNEQMLDLEHPEKNGFNNFQAYLQQVLKVK